MKVDELVLKKYSDAEEIYALQRAKKMNRREKAFDWLVALFTPLPGIVEEADLVSDMGYYYLVIEKNQDLLVRAEKEQITEKKLHTRIKNKKFIVDGNRFKKVNKIYESSI